MPKVSVIIPTWNRENLIRNTIHSAQNQTIKNIEILVCDDGSTDDTNQIVKEINKKDKRVKWIEGKHYGRPAIPRNIGIKKAEGEWIAFLDSDDKWLPQKLERQLKIMKEINCLASATNAWRFIQTTKVKEIFYSYNQKLITFNNLTKINYIVCSSAVIHKSILKITNGFPENKSLKTLEDYAMWLRVATQTNFAFINKPLLIYRDNPENSIRNIGEKDEYIQKKYIYKNFLKWAKESNVSYKFRLKIFLIYIKIFLGITKKLLKKF